MGAGVHASHATHAAVGVRVVRRQGEAAVPCGVIQSQSNSWLAHSEMCGLYNFYQGPTLADFTSVPNVG